MRLRPAVLEDAARLWDWANDAAVRAAAFDQTPVAWERHLAWLTARLAAGCDPLLILETAEHQPIGQLRFDPVAEGWEVDFSVAAGARGRGYGTRLLAAGVAEARRYWPEGTRLIARVLAANTPSLRICQRAGFVITEYGNDTGRPYARLEQQVHPGP